MTLRKKAIHTSNCEADTEHMGAALIAAMGPGCVVALDGDLGAGKTCLVRGAAEALGITQPITSPTFTIVNAYRSGTARLIHMDLYRLSGPDEVLALGFEEYMDEPAYIFIEWPERAEELLPTGTIRVDIRLGKTPNQRHIEISSGAQA